MSDQPSPYSRIDRNRFETRLILAVFAMLLIPVLVFLISYFSFWLFLMAPWAFVALADGPPPSSRLGELLRAAPLIGAATALIVGLLIWRVVAVARSLPVIMGAVPCPPERGGAIWRRLENLSLAAGLPAPRLFLLPSKHANAFATGPDPARASVVVTTGLVEMVSLREFDGVIAHELAHIRNYDTRINSTVAAILRTARLPPPIWWLLVFGLGLSLSGLLLGGDIGFVVEMYSELPPGAFWLLVGWTAITLLALAWPFIGRAIQSVLSRTREFLADAEAATITRDPLGLARALARIAQAPSTKQLPRSKGIEHLCIVPLHATRLMPIFPSHPPLSARISTLEGMGPSEPESREQRPDPDLKAACDELLAWARTKDGRLPTEGLEPMSAALRGFAAGTVVSTVLYVAQLIILSNAADATSPMDIRYLFTTAYSIPGAVAAYAAMRSAGRFSWWPLAVMFFFGGWWNFAVVTTLPPEPGAPTASALLMVYLAGLIQPAVGAVLGVVAAKGLKRIRAGRSSDNRASDRL